MRWLLLTSILLSGFASGSAFDSAEQVQTDPGQITSAEPRILVLGDSLSAAYNIPRQSGWVSLMRQRLQAALPGTTVVNASVSGATTAAGLQVLPDVLVEHDPDLVILELGANDGLQGKPIAHITANLRELIEISQEAGAQVILVGVRLPPNYGRGYTQPFFNQYANLADEYGLAYVPFILDGVAGQEGMMQQDGLHPVADAQPRILENVWPALTVVLAGLDQVHKADIDAVRIPTPIAAK